jgi:hypothetical protein
MQGMREFESMLRPAVQAVTTFRFSSTDVTAMMAASIPSSMVPPSSQGGQGGAAGPRPRPKPFCS